MALETLIKAVQEQNLTKTALEGYYDALTGLYSAIHLELARLEKEEALYLVNFKLKTAIDTTRQWNASQSGQRLIQLDHEARIVEKLLSSIKHRLFNTF
jgi:hypothetical protein